MQNSQVQVFVDRPSIPHFVRDAKRFLIRESIEAFLAARALLFAGTRYTCPVCGLKLRAFTRGGLSFRVRPLGYCPRCNAKARHRRDWLFLKEKTTLFSTHTRLLYVSPNYCFSRRFLALSNLDYVGIDYRNHRNVSVKGNLANIPLRSNAFDAIVCIHVLEHIEQDRQMIRELFRVLKPGGWALVSVPIRRERETYEDPTITTPDARARAFGETVHVRWYGHDLIDRLEEGGFLVQLFLGKDLKQRTKETYGLRDDEDIFYCTKAAPHGSMAGRRTVESKIGIPSENRDGLSAT